MISFALSKLNFGLATREAFYLLSTNTLSVIFFHFQASVDGQHWSLLHHSDIAVKTYLLSHLSSVFTKYTLATMKKYKHIECFQNTVKLGDHRIFLNRFKDTGQKLWYIVKNRKCGQIMFFCSHISISSKLNWNQVGCRTELESVRKKF